MKVFAMLALSVGAILATTSVKAHSHPVMLKGLALSVAHTIHIAPDPVAALASPSTGPTAHVSSLHLSFGGFHSTPSYHSYSPAPSRSFTFRSSSPRISARPAAMSAPRTYNHSPFARSTRSSTPVSRPVEVHHYHNSGGSGLSATDVILLNQALTSGHQNESIGTLGNARGFVLDSQNYSSGEVNKSDDGLSSWQVCGIVLVAAGVGYGLYRFLGLD